MTQDHALIVEMTELLRELSKELTHSWPIMGLKIDATLAKLQPEAPAADPVFKREERYIVIKRKWLSEALETYLRSLLAINAVGTIESVVVERDWPEYEPVWRMLESRMMGVNATQPEVEGLNDLVDAVEAGGRDYALPVLSRLLSEAEARRDAYWAQTISQQTAEIRRLTTKIEAIDKDDNETYEIGKRDGYEKAVQDIDCRTGGDGEYFASTIPGRGCPDPATMIAGIVERFEARGREAVSVQVPDDVMTWAKAILMPNTAHGGGGYVAARWITSLPDTKPAPLPRVPEEVEEAARRFSYQPLWNGRILADYILQSVTKGE